MKTSTIVVAGLLAAAAVQASVARPDGPAPLQGSSASPLTRAEVRAETLRALRAGEVSFGDVDRPIVAPSTAGRTGADGSIRASFAALARRFRGSSGT